MIDTKARHDNEKKKVLGMFVKVGVCDNEAFSKSEVRGWGEL